MRNRVDALTAVIQGFDYAVPDDDFIFYELGRLIEEDRASFDDEEFRRLIDAGIVQHIEERLAIRAALAGHFRSTLPRMDSGTRQVAMKVIHALEDLNVDLRNVAVIVGSYTAYLFEKLERVEPGDPRASQAADELFDAPENRISAENAIGVLRDMPSSLSARVLAHAISEPMLDEALEEKAYDALKAMWPLPRNYMVYTLRSHTHLDLPFRWFQLLVDSRDVAGVDLILEECRRHGPSAAFREDLAAIIELLLAARDPETEEKVIDLLNDPDTPSPIADMLQTLLKAYRKPAPTDASSDSFIDPWVRQDRLRTVHDRYRESAKLYDSGKCDEADRILQDILTVVPEYPFALMLRKIIQSV